MGTILATAAVAILSMAVSPASADGPAASDESAKGVGPVQPLGSDARPSASISELPGGDGDEAPPLPRYREGGTPYNPNQKLTPYAVRLGPGTDVPFTGVIDSPPEYGPTHGVLFRWGTSGYTSVVNACVAALTGDAAHDEIAYVVVASGSQATAASQFASAGADLSKVVFLNHSSNSVWIRDYGPHFIWQNGTLAIVDSHYYPTRPLDNFIPTLVGDDNLGLSTNDMGLYYSGGNFQPGPNRTGFITALINLDNPTSGGHDETLIRELYDEFQGIDTLHIMPQLPFSVDGTGHIDMWLYMVDEDTVIISEFIPGSNATAISITNNAVPYMEGLGFEVFRPKAWNVGSTHYTYANAFRVNDRIFVPVYGTTLVAGGSSSYNDEDADAMAKWAAAAPGVELVPIQCFGIIPAAGAIHCIIKQVPRYTAATPAAHVVSPAGGELWLSGDVETIRWNASDTYNQALSSVDLAYSLNDGVSWTPIATGIADTGSYNWTVPAGNSDQARIRVVAHAADSDTATAISERYKHRPGVKNVYTFATGAGVDKFGAGFQTGSWAANVSGNSAPVATALSAGNYTSIAVSDGNRYTSSTVSGSSECTQLYRFTIAEDPSLISEIVATVEGYALNCTQSELYVWDRVANQWGDGTGLSGQNRYMASYAGSRDETLIGRISGDFADYVAPDGTIRLLVYVERSADETLHDYVALTVKTAAACEPCDLNCDGSINPFDIQPFLDLLGATPPPPCSPCAGDADGNGTVNPFDINAFLACL